MIWRKQYREPQDPTWIFSTWPIPRWMGSGCLLTVTAADGPAELLEVADYVYPGPQEQKRLQQLLDRLGSVNGSVDMRLGTFVLPEPVSFKGMTHSLILGNRFVVSEPMSFHGMTDSHVIGNYFERAGQIR